MDDTLYYKVEFGWTTIVPITEKYLKVGFSNGDTEKYCYMQILQDSSYLHHGGSMGLQNPTFEGFQRNPRISNPDNPANQTWDGNGFEI